MGQPYSVKIKFDTKDDNQATKMTQEFFDKQRWSTLPTVNSVDDVLRSMFHEVSDQGGHCVADFDASYGWEDVMYRWFNAVAPALKDGSYLRVVPWQEGDPWKVVVKGGKGVEVSAKNESKKVNEPSVKNPNFDQKKFGRFFDKDGKLIPELADEYFKTSLGNKTTLKLKGNNMVEIPIKKKRFVVMDKDGNQVGSFEKDYDAVKFIKKNAMIGDVIDKDYDYSVVWTNRRKTESLKESKKLLKEDKEIWASDGMERYYYNADISELKDEMDDIGADYSNMDEDDIRRYFLDDEFTMEQDYENFEYNILPEISKQCYADVLVLFGDYARWDGSRGAAKVLPKADKLSSFIYPEYEATTRMFQDETGVYYTQSTHDTPMGGTKIYLYSLKSEDDIQKLEDYLIKNSGWYDPEYDYSVDFLEDHSDYNDIKEYIDNGILTPIKL